jgi:hypothetical protein
VELLDEASEPRCHLDDAPLVRGHDAGGPHLTRHPSPLGGAEGDTELPDL